MSKLVDVLGVSLDSAGRVVLSDEDLDRAFNSEDLVVAGADVQSNRACCNGRDCEASGNIQCTNVRGACGGSTNIGCRDVDTID